MRYIFFFRFLRPLPLDVRTCMIIYIYIYACTAVHIVYIYIYIEACESPTPRRRPTLLQTTTKKKKAFRLVYVTHAFQHARPPRTTTFRYILCIILMSIILGRRRRYMHSNKRFSVFSRSSVSIPFIFSLTFFHLASSHTYPR